MVFNPAPVGEAFGHEQQEFGDGGGQGGYQPQLEEVQHSEYQYGSHGQQHDAYPTRQEQQAYNNYQQRPPTESHHQYASYSSTSYPSAATPHSYASPDSQSQQQQQYTSPTPREDPTSPYSTEPDGSVRRNSKRLSQSLPQQPMPHEGPQLQPLPHFGSTLSVTQVAGAGETERQLAQPSSRAAQPLQQYQREQQLSIAKQQVVGSTPVVDGYASRSPAPPGGLAAPLGKEAYDRTSLAYLGEAPASSHRRSTEEEDEHDAIEEREAREAQEAFEDEALEREVMAQRAAEEEQRTREEQAAQYAEYSYDAPQGPSVGGGGGYTAGRADYGNDQEGLAVPANQHSVGLSPIVEVPTPAMTHAGESPNPSESGNPGRDVYRYNTLQQPPQQPPARSQSPAARAGAAAFERAVRTYTPEPAYSQSPAPSSPSSAVAPPPSFHTSVAPSSVPPLGAFEPRPLTPSSARKPIQIRPGDSALGSKHGDLTLASPTVPSADASGAGGKRTVPAGAFRRGTGGPPPATGGVGAGGPRPFAASGYNPSQPPPPSLERSQPSESELIAQQYRSSAIPLTPEMSQQEYEMAVRHNEALEARGPGQTPQFDTRPLSVTKGLGQGSSSQVGRSGTLPFVSSIYLDPVIVY